MAIKKSGMGDGVPPPPRADARGPSSEAKEASTPKQASKALTLAEVLGKEIDRAKARWKAAEGSTSTLRRSWDSLGGALRVASKHYVSDLAQHTSALDVLIRGALGADPKFDPLLSELAFLTCRKSFQSLGFSSKDAERLVHEALIFMMGPAVLQKKQSRGKKKLEGKKRTKVKSDLDDDITDQEDAEEDDLVEGVHVISEAMREALEGQSETIELRLRSVLLALRSTAKRYEPLDKGGESFQLRVIAAETLLGSLVGLAEKKSKA